MKKLYILLFSAVLLSCEKKQSVYAVENENTTFSADETELIEEEESAVDCSNAKSYAGYGYDYAKKAYNSDNIEDIQFYARKAMSEFESSMSYASDCDCNDANYAADEAYTNAKKAYNSETVEDGEYYAKKAMTAAEDVDSYATSCEN